MPKSRSSPCPTITLEGDANGAPHPEPSSYAKKFSGKYEHRTIKGGIGHNLPQEAPQAFAEAVVDVAAKLDRVSLRSRQNAECGITQVANGTHHAWTPEKSCTPPRPAPPVGGTHGVARSSDGRLDVRLSAPGSARIGTNPEQLFAAGWSACFESAIALAARQKKIALPGEVDDRRRAGPRTCSDGGYVAERPRSTSACRGSSATLAQALVDEAHKICPYSKATRGNIDVAINLV